MSEAAPRSVPGRARDRVGPGVADLIADLAQDFSALVRGEGRLLRAELGASAKTAAVGAEMMAAGAAVCLLSGVVIAIAMTLLLAQAIGPFWAAIVVGLGFGLIGALLLRGGRQMLVADRSRPHADAYGNRLGYRAWKGALVMSDMSQDLEREIEAHRSGVEQTVDKLKQRLSPDQIFNDIGRFIGVDDLQGLLATAGRNVRENPLAIGMIGAGLAWLMIGRNPDSARKTAGESSDWDVPHADTWGRGRDIGGDLHAEADDADPASGSLVGKVKKTASAVGGTLAQVPGKVTDTAGHATDRLQAVVGSIRDGARTTARPLKDTMTAQPLLLGAAAVAVGAIIGSALPRTRVENRLLGPQRDKLFDEVASAGQELAERASDAARRTYAEASRAARDEGLVSEEETLAARVERVATVAVEAAKSEIAPVLQGSRKQDRTSSRERRT